MRYFAKAIGIAFLALMVVFVPTKAVFASASDGTISGFGWSSNIGWVNFGITSGNTHVTDSALTGFAWNENKGRINLNPTTSGVKNTCSGVLSGKAWSEGTGWIDFTGVTIGSSGRFSGAAAGDNGVDINFDCDHCNVSTDWRPCSVRNATGSTGGGGGGGSVAIISPSGPLGLTINNGNTHTNSLAVALVLTAGSNVTDMALSNSLDFSTVAKEPYVANKIWNLSAGDGQKTVYVKFYTKENAASATVSASIILDTLAPTLTITSVKNTYAAAENSIIAGTTESNATVNILIDNRYGVVNADAQGNWAVNFGVLGAGGHRVEFSAVDAANNIGATVVVNFSVAGVGQQQPTELPLPFSLAPPLAPIFRQLAEGVQSLIPKFFQPLEKTKPAPPVVVTVPKQAPLALNGNFNFHYISTNTLARLVWRPLPADVRLLAQKFPQVEKTFNAVGVNKITDLQKLSNANLKLPTLTETALPQPALAVGKFTVPKGVPVEKLSAVALSRVPSEIVFAKAAGGLVDLDVALSINNQGKPIQQIATISGQNLQLVVKPERPVRKITGYVVFKSKKYTPPSVKSNLNNMSASLLFANPTLATAVQPAVQVPVGGAPLATNITIDAKTVSVNDLADKERWLVISTFEYQDSGNGIYTSTIQAPVVDGEYEIITVMDYQDITIQSKEIRLVTLVDPEGYIYEKHGDLETRIAGAVASLYYLNPATKQYELWPAKDFQQENPQITDVRGTYSFLVPNGYYYLKVDAPGYESYDGKPFEVKEGGGIHINVEMKTKYWFLTLIDWKTLLMGLIILLLLYNFYKDKIRDKALNK